MEFSLSDESFSEKIVNSSDSLSSNYDKYWNAESIKANVIWTASTKNDIISKIDKST